jgi:hypothetical protein
MGSHRPALGRTGSEGLATRDAIRALRRFATNSRDQAPPAPELLRPLEPAALEPEPPALPALPPELPDPPAVPVPAVPVPAAPAPAVPVPGVPIGAHEQIASSVLNAKPGPHDAFIVHLQILTQSLPPLAGSQSSPGLSMQVLPTPGQATKSLHRTSSPIRAPPQGFSRGVGHAPPGGPQTPQPSLQHLRPGSHTVQRHISGPGAPPAPPATGAPLPDPLRPALLPAWEALDPALPLIPAGRGKGWIDVLSLHAPFPIHNPQPSTTIQNFGISTLVTPFDMNARPSAEVSTRRIRAQVSEPGAVKC